jgi:phage I-like protein
VHTLRHIHALSVDGPELPTEFRLFVSGWNDTENGAYLFDAEAARATLEAAAKWGVDLAIDLEHQMLDTAGADPTARDARGWFNLELRDDGSLWAVNVRWTPDGAARLAEKRQRYISPAFEIDPESKRVTKIVNAAITSIPATHDTPALVAARTALGEQITATLSAGVGMNPKLVQEALDALIADDAAKCQEILKSLVAAAAGAEAEVEAEEPAVEAEAAAVPAEEPAVEAAAAAPGEAEDDEDKEAVAAAISRLTRTTGKTTIGAAVDEIEVWRKSHVELEAQRAQIAKEREALELSQRKENAAKLVQLGAETPHTSGLASFANGAKGKLAKRLLDEPLAEQTARVAELLAARGGKMPEAPKPPSGRAASKSAPAPAPSQFFDIDGKQVEVTARELVICEQSKCDPKIFATLKSRRSATSA